ncbi:MAG: CsbD family protein [Thermoanaerobaculia bacterium]
MNRDVLAGKWHQLKGEIQRTWGELTDDDFDRAAGSAENLAGVLRERYGWSREEAARRVAVFVDLLAERFSEPARSGSRL